MLSLVIFNYNIYQCVPFCELHIHVFCTFPYLRKANAIAIYHNNYECLPGLLFADAFDI